MNNRISSNMMYDQSVFLMLSRQSKINQLERQLATGQKLVTAKDDPVAAGTGVGMDRVLAELDQLGANAANVQNRLGLQESVLAQAGELLARTSELTVHANNAALSTDDRKSLASELHSIRESLLALANSTDGNGRYLFGGAADSVPPFSSSNGSVNYNGDQTQRQVEVSPNSFVKDAQPGSEVFMRIRTGDGIVDGNAAGTNTGLAVLSDISRDGSAAWNGESFTISFTTPDTYDLLDGNGNVIDSGVYTSGEDINTQGLRLRLTGVPEPGDAFTLGQAGNRDVFGTLDRLAQALEMDTSTLAGRTAQQNLLQSSLRDVARASEQLIDARATGGAQLGALDNAASLREASAITLKDSLSQLRDLDYAEAIGQYKLENASLQAAQTIFAQMQSMSLFNMIR